MSDEALNKHLDWLDKCAEEYARESSRGKYCVHYSNQGKREKSKAWNTRKEAEVCKEFLRFQGATSISIHKGER